MAIFGDKKNTKKTGKTQKRRVTRTNILSGGIAHEIIRAPWFSEKALVATEKGIYVFVVPPRATKAEIAGAIKEVYKVEPRAVRVANLPGKRKAMRTKRGMGTRPARTKAYVTLNAGDSIQFA